MTILALYDTIELMDKKNNNPKRKGHVNLEQITLAYEYDKTYREIVKQNKSRAQ